MRLGVCVAVFAACLCGAAAYDNGAPHAKLPPIGWSSWVALGPGAEHPIFDYCGEESVKAAADALASDELGLFAAGYRHFHLDDCWAGGRFANGSVYPEADHFPNGMKPVVDYVHSKGLTFGLYTCAGTETCVGGRPGSKDHWQLDANSYAEWGVDWVKMDWCNTNGMEPASTYPLMSKALNNTGRPIALNMCEWGKDAPWTWGYPVAQSWRATGDHEGTWDSTQTIIGLMSLIPEQYSGRPYGWNDMDMLETLNGVRAAHANGKEGTLTYTESVTEFTMWAINASPLIVTTPIMNCTQPAPQPVSQCHVTLTKQLSHATCTEGTSFGCSTNGSMWTNNGCRGDFMCNGVAVQCNVDGAGMHTCACNDQPATCTPWIEPGQKEILTNTEVIAINQDVTPQGRPVKQGDLTVWARNMSDGSVAVALYNQDDADAKIGFDFTSIWWAPATQAHIRDLWAHKDLGSFNGTFPPVTVPAHGTNAYRVYKM